MYYKRKQILIFCLLKNFIISAKSNFITSTQGSSVFKNLKKRFVADKFKDSEFVSAKFSKVQEDKSKRQRVSSVYKMFISLS